MLERFDLLSINQTSAQIKLLEAWKASRNPNYPINLTKTRLPEEEQMTINVRLSTRREMREGRKTKQSNSSFTRDTGKL